MIRSDVLREFDHAPFSRSTAIKGQVFGPTAFQRHGRVRVHIAEIWRDGVIVTVDDLVGLKTDRGPANAGDVFAGNRQISPAQNALRFVQRDDIGVLDQDVQAGCSTLNRF
jgi:hypothetical protein